MKGAYHYCEMKETDRSGRLETTVDFITWVVLVLGLLFLACAGAQGSIYSLTPNPADLYDLDHNYYYTWGMDRPWKADETAVSATLSFSKIYNWDNEPNVLYIHLLDKAEKGVKSGSDTKEGDYFGALGTMLVTYTNLPDKAQNLSYSFTPSQVKMLNEYASDGRFGLGFDPDCHFYNSGAKLEIVTGSVPEPQTLAFLAVGAVGWIRQVRLNRKRCTAH